MSCEYQEVSENINRFISDELPAATEAQMKQVCLFIEGEAKKLCPSTTGTLRASITSNVEVDGEKVVGVIGSNLDYAPYVHQGTGIHALEGKGRKQVPWTYYDEKKGEWVTTEGIEPSPFIQDAIDANRDIIFNYFQGVLGNVSGTDS